MIGRVVVVVPAADEALLLPGCLTALRAAADRLRAARPGVLVETVVVLDACTDDSARVVAAFGEVRAVSVAARSVGVARRAGADHALAAGAGPDVLLASTDADSRVPAHWLTALVALADDGADLVLGTVEPVDLPAAIAQAYRSGYDPADEHAHVHGANLAIRADVYRRLGGWPPVRGHEDRLLAAAAVLAGDVRIRRVGGIAVATAARLEGRTPVGFAGYLRALADVVEEDEQETA